MRIRLKKIPLGEVFVCNGMQFIRIKPIFEENCCFPKWNVRCVEDETDDEDYSYIPNDATVDWEPKKLENDDESS